MPDRIGALAPRRGIPSYPLLGLPSEGTQTWRVDFWTPIPRTAWPTRASLWGAAGFCMGLGRSQEAGDLGVGSEAHTQYSPSRSSRKAGS